MYEVLELLNTKELEKRILPVILEDTNFLNPQSRTIYYDYWDDEINKTKANLDKYVTQDFFNEFKHQKNIRNMIDIFFVKVSDLKTVKFRDLKESSYESILQIINSNNSPILDKKQTKALTLKAMIENESHLEEEINNLQELFSAWKDKNITDLQRKRIEDTFIGKEFVWDVFVLSVSEIIDGEINLIILANKEVRLDSAYALAFFDSKDEESLALICKGEKIRIKGRCDRFLGSPILKDCKILNRLNE